MNFKNLTFLALFFNLNAAEVITTERISCIISSEYNPQITAQGNVNQEYMRRFNSKYRKAFKGYIETIRTCYHYLFFLNDASGAPSNKYIGHMTCFASFEYEIAILDELKLADSKFLDKALEIIKNHLKKLKIKRLHDKADDKWQIYLLK